MPMFPGQMRDPRDPQMPRDPRFGGEPMFQHPAGPPPVPGATPPPAPAPDFQQLRDTWQAQRPDHVPGMGGGQMDAWRDSRPQRPDDPISHQQMQDWRGLMPDRNGMHGADWHNALDTWRTQMPGYQPPPALPPMGQPMPQQPMPPQMQPPHMWGGGGNRRGGLLD